MDCLSHRVHPRTVMHGGQSAAKVTAGCRQGTEQSAKRIADGNLHCCMGAMGRGPEWKVREELDVARAVVRTRRGGEYRGKDQFWARAFEEFKATQPLTLRTPATVAGRWRKIQLSLANFTKHFAAAQREHPGWTYEQLMRMAIEKYKFYEKDAFSYCHIWEYMRNPDARIDHVASGNADCQRIPLAGGAPGPLPAQAPGAASEHDQLPGSPRNLLTTSLLLSHGSPSASAPVHNHPQDGAAWPDSPPPRDDRVANDDHTLLLREVVREMRVHNENARDQNRLNLFTIDTTNMDETSKKFFDVQRRVELAKAIRDARNAGINVDT
ncbi:Myb/SANT-like domain-containing protein [Plasmodiophora brassicae]